MVAVVLAAGTASRFGATKQVATLDGRPLIGHVVAAAVAAGCDEVVVVVGHDAASVAAAARQAGPVTVVDNPAYADGQATSLRAGIAAADTAGADVAVILLADEPDVAPVAVRAVADATGREVLAARARYDDAPGHPVAFARGAFDRLREVRGDRGARGLLAELGVVDVPVEGPRPGDLDRPDDLAARERD